MKLSVRLLFGSALALPLAAQTQPVEIYYDAYGIAHIFGATDEAAMYGHGYHQMREYPIGTLDRLWRFSGRMAEVAGPSYLDADYKNRLWEVPTIVANDVATLPPDILRMVRAYVQGINDGRAFWRAGGVVPSQSPLLEQVIGNDVDPDRMLMRFDPLPDYFNQGFHQFQFDPDSPTTIHPDYHPDDVPRYMERIIDRMFAPELPITVEHVLALSRVVNSAPGLLYLANEIGSLPNDDGFTNAWMVSKQATGGPAVTLNDPHTGRDKLTTRPHLVQIHGDTYRASGIAAPGVSVYSGFSDHLSWLLSGSSDNDALQRTSWDVRLLENLPLGFRLSNDGKAAQHSLGGPLTRVRLQSESETLTYFDPVASRDLDSDGQMDAGEIVYRTQVRERYYVPDPLGLGLPNDRHPVTQINGALATGEAPPQPGDTIRFRAATFPKAGNHWEFWIRLGRAQHLDGAPPGEDQVSDIYDEVNTGWDNNYLAADYRGRFYFQYLAIVPELTPALLATLDNEELRGLGTEQVVLDGGRLSQRWQGFHDFETLPSIGPVTITTPESWLSCNPTPDQVELGPNNSGTGKRFTAADLAALPEEMMRPQSVQGWRNLRARELLQSTSVPGALAGASEAAGRDVTDPQARGLWPFFVRAFELKESELTPADPDFQWLDEADLFLQWVETHRHLTDDGLTYDPAHDFEAHPYSLVTVYTSLLTSWFERARNAATTDPVLLGFGEDTLDPLFLLGPAAMVRPTHDALIESLWDALVGGGAVAPGAVPLWELGSGSGGLVNYVLFLQTWAHAAWSGDPRFSDTQLSVDPLFAADMGGTRVTRWGLFNQLVLTSHAYMPGRVTLNPAERTIAQMYTGLRPDLLPGYVSTDPVVERLKFPLYMQQTPVVFPLAGTEESLFLTRNGRVTQGASPIGTDQALYKTTDSGPFAYLAYMPHDQGSQVVIQAELSDPPAGRGKFLCATGPTELSIPLLPGQNRYLTSQDFATRTWRDLETDQSVLAANHVHHEHLEYTPVP
jgi:hypothetical protein